MAAVEVAIVAAQLLGRFISGGEVAPAEWAVAGRRETDRFGEPIGADVRTVDNSGSDVELARSMTISNSTERQFKFDLEKSSKVGGSVGLDATVHGVGAKLSTQAERAVKTVLSTSELQRHSVEEKLEFTAPARTLLTITLSWKRIWQRGEVTLRNANGETLLLPYEESVGLDFDLSAVTFP